MAGISGSSPKVMNVVAFVVFLVAAMVCLSQGYPSLKHRRPNPRTCGEAELCCPGQNNTCFVFGTRVDRSEGSKRCYCDSNCLIMGDCCMDYHHVCRSVDCHVGDWAEWSTCDNPCGYGTRRRTRDVKTHPDNGGHHCPVLKQRRACVGYVEAECQQNLLTFQEEELAEKARILPLTYGVYRADKKYNAFKGILKNLYHKYFNEIFVTPTYRTVFKVTEARDACGFSEWADVLKVNSTVCVECQPAAMNREIGMRCKGHGVYGRSSLWTAVGISHCHGKWVMTQPHESDVCDGSVDSSFIFI